MKLLLDEMYPAVIARTLRERGFDVASVHDAPGRGTTDADVFSFARAEGRTIVTENVRDYRPLAEAVVAEHQHHPGLIFSTHRRWPRGNPGPIITMLEDFLASGTEVPRDSEMWP